MKLRCVTTFLYRRWSASSNGFMSLVRILVWSVDRSASSNGFMSLVFRILVWSVDNILD